jgi:dihydroorotase
MNYLTIPCNIFISLIVINLYCSAFRINNETELWKSFKIKHGKNYKSQKEEDKKREIWSRKISLIKKHNLRNKLGLETYSLAENSFVDFVCDIYF